MRYVDIEKAEYPYMSMSMFGINSKDCRIYNEGVKATEDMIQALPTADVVEVVRCKDCVMHKKGCPLDTHPYMTPDDGYCYKGKRRTDNE